MIFRQFLQISLYFFISLGAAYADDPRARPEHSTQEIGAVSRAEGRNFMIVTANPHATKAGYEILERGGSAMDAAIAAQLVLGLVEPQSSGLGGGAFVLHYDAETRALNTYDGRETAPGLAGPFLFYERGKALAFKEARLGGRSVGVPGLPALLYDLHERYGTATWIELFEEAVHLAENGFEVSPRLHHMIAEHAEDLSRFPYMAATFLDADGQAHQIGATLKNDPYAETLKDFAFYGSQIFYRGHLADSIIAAVQNNLVRPGAMTRADMTGYEVKTRDPVCAPYRRFIVCSMGEPSSGGLTLLQILGLIERFDLAAWGKDDPKSWSVIAQANALAFADRNAYMADPDFVDTPGILLLDPNYVAARSAIIDPEQPLQDIEKGVPPLWDGPLYPTSNTLDKPGTTHISVIDAGGDIVSMTSSIESAFGSHIMVGGFLLNNQLTDFSFEPFAKDGDLIANMVEGGKRPRSSMSPTIVFDRQGKPVLILGSAGGSRIIGYVLQRIIAALDWEMDVGDALAMAHIGARGATLEMEREQSVSNALREKGFAVAIKDMNSGLTAIHIRGDTYIGAADPRREGKAMGN